MSKSKFRIPDRSDCNQQVSIGGMNIDYSCVPLALCGDEEIAAKLIEKTLSMRAAIGWKYCGGFSVSATGKVLIFERSVAE